MDRRENLIFIKNEEQTANVNKIEFCNEFWLIKFENSPKSYKFSLEDVLWFDKPDDFPMEGTRVYLKGEIVSGVSLVRRFSNDTDFYWYLEFFKDYPKVFKRDEVKVVRSCLHDEGKPMRVNYLSEIAQVTGLRRKTEWENMLVKKYNMVADVRKDTVAANYIVPSKTIRCNNTRQLFFPFGLNSSQLAAVEKALNNQVSIIQGTPGTGKTQTILNIIANLILQSKTVLVVSNNNAAVDNVREKLCSLGLGFMVAQLGRKENRESFLRNQSEAYPEELSQWQISHKEMSEADGKMPSLIEKLKDCFVLQERFASLKAETSALELEYSHYLKERDGNQNNLVRLRPFFSARGLLGLYMQFCDLASEEQPGVLRTWFLNNLKYPLSRLWFDISAFARLENSAKLKSFADDKITDMLALSYYEAKKKELKQELDRISRQLKLENANELLNEIKNLSIKKLKGTVWKKYCKNKSRPQFDEYDFYVNSKSILDEYPIVTSTTFSAVGCLGRDVVYDYVIMDEASQISLETGFLALTVAKNIVIVGDKMQLPNVIKSDDKKIISSITSEYSSHLKNVMTSYNATSSFLDSAITVFSAAPQTLLKEHYRCHPKIIDFCNKKFYAGKLVIMTQDKGEEDVLLAMRSAKGKHSSNHENLREIQIIQEEIRNVYYKNYADEDIGIIAPYVNQVKKLDREFENVNSATVHKFQGREKKVMIMTATDDIISDFADDPNLLNVAVSRAQERFCLVLSGNKQPKEGNITDLLKYINYVNCKVEDSKIHSIFDYLYSQCESERKKYLAKHKSVSRFDSENLFYALIDDILKERQYEHLKVLHNYPLSHIFKNTDALDTEEKVFVSRRKSHVDFLLFNTITKLPLCAMEVDGKTYHKQGSRQYQRDTLKNSIFQKYGIPMLRFSTDDKGEKDKIERFLDSIL